MQALLIESLDQEGRGVARRDGKVIFVDGALPGELVEVVSYRRKASYEFASVTRVRRASSQRVEPRCPFFARCGGCSLQHFDPRAQLAVKQRVLEDSLWHVGKVRAETILAPIHGSDWGYRHRARLSARFVPKKGGMLVGFHEKRSSYVADMTSCEVLPREVSALLAPLRETLGRLTIRERVPQIEVAVGERATALVVRVLLTPAPEDRLLLEAFADRYGVELYLQPAGPDSAQPMRTGTQAPAYVLPEFDLALRFSPTDFTQVNHAVNRLLVRRAVSLLDPRPGERVADLFCGIGNFALAIARRGAVVSGIEGNATLVARAAANARDNGLADTTRFSTANLFELSGDDAAELARFDRMLIDPPRDGAIAVVKALGGSGLRRIVYVSCNPATLARDAAVLVYAQGYRLSHAGVVNMFPHTSHIESIAVFDR